MMQRFIPGLVLVLMLSCSPPPELTGRSILVHNFSDDGYERYPVYVTLAFPEKSVTEQDLLDELRVLDEQGDALFHQIEDHTTFSDGSVRWAGLWLEVTLGPRASAEYELELGGRAKPARPAPSVTIGAERVQFSTSSLPSVVLRRDSGLAWEVSGEPIPVVRLCSETRRGDRSKLRPACSDGEKEPPADVKLVQQGPLFVKVAWSLLDRFGNYRKGWIRVFDSQPIIELWTEGEAPVTGERPRATMVHSFPYRPGSVREVNTGRISYAVSGDGGAGVTNVLYTNPSNLFGNTGRHGEHAFARGGPAGSLSMHLVAREAHEPEVEGRLGASIAVVFSQEDAEREVLRYTHRPIASYHCPEEDHRTRAEIHELVDRFFAEHGETFAETYLMPPEAYGLSLQRFKALAVLIALDNVKRASRLETFSNWLNELSTPDSESWRKQWAAQIYPNVLLSACHVYRQTGDERVKAGIGRVLDDMRQCYDEYEPIGELALPINKREAVYAALSCVKEATGDPRAELLLSRFGTRGWLYDSPEAFREDFFPKYKVAGQGFHVAIARTFNNYVTTAYLIDPFPLAEAGYELDMELWLASYGVLQSSVWWRTRGMIRDDWMWERAKYSQDRLGHTASYLGYVKSYLNLDPRHGVSGTAMARLSLEYLRSVTDESGFIPFAEEEILRSMERVWPTAEYLIGKPAPPGWYSNVGLFEIVFNLER